jgi:hypothetical protein
MNTGFTRSKRCVEKLRVRTPKTHQPQVRPRLLGPRILRSKSKFPRIPFGRPHSNGRAPSGWPEVNAENAIFLTRSVLVQKYVGAL